MDGANTHLDRPHTQMDGANTHMDRPHTQVCISSGFQICRFWSIIFTEINIVKGFILPSTNKK